MKSVYQILILAAFLFLAAFSAVWFDEGEGKEETEWASKTAGGASAFLDAIVRLSSPSSNSFSTGVRLQADDAAEKLEGLALRAENEVDYAAGSISTEAGSMSLPPVLGDTDSGFKDFVREILTEAPSRYLDIRLYNKGFKDFFSFYWLGLTGGEETSISY